VDGGHEGGLAGEGGVVFLEEGSGGAVECGVGVGVDEEAGYCLCCRELILRSFVAWAVAWVRTTRTSRRVSLVSQSLFSVSTHTLPETSSTFGCQMRVLKAALGGFLG